MGDWTGTVPSFPVGNLRAEDMTTLADIDSALATAWTTWSPTLTNLTLGSGTLIAKYRRVGKTVDFFWRFVYGAASAVGTDPTFTLPVSAAAELLTAIEFPATGRITDASAGSSRGQIRAILNTTANTVTMYYFNAATTVASITATVPWTWTTSDSLSLWGTYYTD